MSKRSVVWFLCAYFAVVLTGVVFQIDRFPLTWVPMYSSYTPSKDPDPDAEQKVKVRDKDEAAKGLFCTHRDGSQSRVGLEELNLPKRNMWRLYFERPFDNAPPKYDHANDSLDALSRWARGLEPGELNMKADWARRVFATVNKTLGYQPDDPRFVVEIRAYQQVRYYRNFELTRTRLKDAHIVWKDAWAEDFE